MDAREAEFRRRLSALGFDEVRIAALTPAPGSGLRDWLAAGMHADMDWMERTAEKRSDPQLVLPGAKSVVMLGVNYWSGENEQQNANVPRWARYALHEDYHDTIKPALAFFVTFGGKSSSIDPRRNRNTIAHTAKNRNQA